MKKYFLLALCAATLFGVTSCEQQEKPKPGNENNGTIVVSPETLTLSIGQEERLQATIDPAPTTRVKFTWVSSDPAVATVTSGIVKAEGLGTAQVIVSAEGYTSDTCIVNVTNDAALDTYQFNNYGLFGDPTMLEGVVRDIETTTGKTYKCQAGTIYLFGWDNNVTFVNGTGFGGKGFFFETEVTIWWIVEGESAGYYIGSVDGFYIKPNPQDTLTLYSGKGGELVDVQKYGEFWDQYLLTTDETTAEEWDALYANYYNPSQTGTQICQVDFDNNWAQSYNLGNVTNAHFFENEADELQYALTIDWYDYVNDNRFYGLLIDETGENIVKPYDMRTIHKEYTNIVEAPAEAPAYVIGNKARIHTDADYAVKQVQQALDKMYRK